MVAKHVTVEELTPVSSNDVGDDVVEKKAAMPQRSPGSSGQTIQVSRFQRDSPV